MRLEFENILLPNLPKIAEVIDVEVRCDGHQVEFSGNISRYGRQDNLFGFTFADSIERINELLKSLGLPPFTAGKLYKFADSGWTWTGARVSRIDITCN